MVDSVEEMSEELLEKELSKHRLDKEKQLADKSTEKC